MTFKDQEKVDEIPKAESVCHNNKKCKINPKQVDSSIEEGQILNNLFQDD